MRSYGSTINYVSKINIAVDYNMNQGFVIDSVAFMQLAQVWFFKWHVFKKTYYFLVFMGVRMVGP